MYLILLSLHHPDLSSEKSSKSMQKRDVFLWGAGCAGLAWDIHFSQIGSLYLRPVIYILDYVVKR